MSLRVVWWTAPEAYQKGTADLGTPSFSQNPEVKWIELANGTGAYQADRFFSDTRTILTAATDSLDLAGSLGNLLGGLLTFAKVKGVWIKAAATNTTNLTIGGGSNAFVGPMGATGTATIKPDMVWDFLDPVTGFTVTAATGDILQVVNGSGASATYDIAIVGTSV